MYRTPSSTSFHRRGLAAALAVALGCVAGPVAAQALTPTFTYQGELRLSSGPATGNFDMQFLLYGAVSGGAQIGSTITVNNVAVNGGLFAVPLDFGVAQFAGERQWLEIRIRPAGSGSFETLSPRTEVTAAPYAWSAAVALANSVTTTSIVDGTIGSADINPAQVQRRVTGNCPSGQYVRVVAQDGTVTCGTDANSGGTVTSIVTGTGLTGGPISTTGTIGVAAGGIGAMQINSAEVQRRVAGTCTGTNYVQQVNADGTVGCGPAPVASGWSLTGNAGTSPATNFLGTTDAQPLVLGVNNQAALRIEPNATSPNLIGGFSGNAVTAGVAGATIAGGGASGSLNRVTDSYGTVGGGAANRAGDDAGSVYDRPAATVGGGYQNTASGTDSTVGGGLRNTASGSWSTVGGGLDNCAGGIASWAGGFRAKVRPASDPGSGSCSGLPSYPGGSGDAGSFVWADAQNANFVSTGSNQFLVRASGGIFLGTGGPVSIPAGRFLNTSSGAHLTTGGTWTNASSRAFKADFAAIDPLDVLGRVLRLGITTWAYRDSTEGRRMGPVAEEFHALFGLGGDDRSISTVDADGVALAAIQGLNAKLEAENAALRADSADLRARLDRLEALVVGRIGEAR